jgi:hypothetical protein
VLQKLGLDEVAHELLAPAASGGVSLSGGAPTSTTSADCRVSRDCLRYDHVAPSRGSASKEKALSFKALNTSNKHGGVQNGAGDWHLVEQDFEGGDVTGEPLSASFLTAGLARTARTAAPPSSHLEAVERERPLARCVCVCVCVRVCVCVCVRVCWVYLENICLYMRINILCIHIYT